MVSEKTGLSQDKAQVAVNTVIGYLKNKLPAPMASQLDNAVSGGGASSGIAGKIGDVFGKTG
jgi:hypothetical protein